MIYSKTETSSSKGLILAHSFNELDLSIKKGTKLTEVHISAIQKVGIKNIYTAKLEKDDLSEDAAAFRIGQSLSGSPNIRIAKPSAGRLNLYALETGVLKLKKTHIDLVNAIDPSITIASLSNFSTVLSGQLIATVKIIPYGVKENLVKKVCRCVSINTFELCTPTVKFAALIMTSNSILKESVLKKSIKSVSDRLLTFGVKVSDVLFVKHQVADVSDAFLKVKSKLVLFLPGYATSDINDVGPEALRCSEGRLERFGMPVDPGNLLFLGEMSDGRAVIGLPGCARSPALNGADWVINRIICGIPVSSASIAAMGVGGLLKEIPSRPRPRVLEDKTMTSKRIEILLLAAGASSRMKGSDKLLKELDGKTLLEHSARQCAGSNADKVYTILAPNSEDKSQILKDLGVFVSVCHGSSEGMAASIRHGLSLVNPQTDAIIVALADMPNINSGIYNSLISSFDVGQNREICRAVTVDGKPGHPVLFGRRFFENMRLLRGDEGARSIIDTDKEYVFDVPTEGDAAIIDIDTDEDLLNWKKAKVIS